MSASLLYRFDQAVPHLCSTLVPPSSRNVLRHIARILPVETAAGFLLECRLGSASRDAPVDLSVAVTRGCRDAFLQRLPFDADRASGGWGRIVRLFQAWADPTTALHAHTSTICLEFDAVAAHDAELPVPGVFVRIDRALVDRVPAGTTASSDRMPHLGESLALLFDDAVLPRRALHRCLRALPPSVRLLWIARMITRPVSPLRLSITDVSAPDIVSFLRAVEWKGAATDAFAKIQALLHRTDEIALAVDVAQHSGDASAVGTRIGLECRMKPWSPVSAARCSRPPFTPLVDALYDAGLCTSIQRDAMLNWHGVQRVRGVHAPHAVLTRALEVVKLVLVPGGPVTAKVYPGVRHLDLPADPSL